MQRDRTKSAGSQTALLALLLASALWTASSAEAAESAVRLGPVEASVRVEPDDALIGDPIRVTIEAVAEAGVELLMPAFGEALDRFRIVDFVPKERVEDDGRTVHSQRYTLQAPVSGEHTLPSILIEFVDRRPGHPLAPDDRDAYELLTDPISFEVGSVVPDSATADLSPPLGRLALRGEGTASLLPWLLGGAILLAAAAPFALRLLRRWRERASKLSAYDRARRELDALLDAPRPGPSDIDGFFVELSGIVRRYLENRFSLRSPELTTEGFLESVSASPDLSDAHQGLLREFLSQADLVKFAHHIPSPDAIDRAIRFAERFVAETREGLAPGAHEPQIIGAQT
jgi:hypothetical protein